MGHIGAQLGHIEKRIATHERRLANFVRAITRHVGGLWFLIFNAVLLIGWIEWNLGLFGFPIFDPYPFSLLALVFAVEAVFLSALILMNQSQDLSEKRHVRTDSNTEVRKMLAAREEHPRLTAKSDVIHLPESRDRNQEITLEQIQREIERNSDF